MIRKYAGLFALASATLMYEVLLTRIFSVTMWYHFAFMAISIAMFGMTFGAVLVYLQPSRFTPERRDAQLSFASLAFAFFLIVGFLLHLALPYLLNAGKEMLPWHWLIYVVATFLVTLVPFTFSGIGVTLALTGLSAPIGRLYASDLAGAALGCLATLALFSFMDGPSLVFVTAAVAGLAALAFSPAAGPGRKRAWAGGLMLAALALGATASARLGHPPIQIRWAKSNYMPKPLFEDWNSFSRVWIGGDSATLEEPVGWGLSPAYRDRRPIRQLHMNIDAAAYTPLTGFTGDTAELAHLKWDVTNMAHHLRRDADVMVVGVGGGRDLLSALAFGQASVLGVELNGAILKAVNGTFGGFTGHLDRHPKVTMVNDEALSWLARSSRAFDILQVSLVDTWAATSAGAFVLSESGLYTVEAWDTFLHRLKPAGILTFSRWYYRDRPAEMYRLTALACEALRRQGVARPREHLLMLRLLFPTARPTDVPEGIGTILVGREAFTPEETALARAKAAELGFEMVLDPAFAVDSTFSAITADGGNEAFLREYLLDISAPTENRPFFFHVLRLSSALNWNLWKQGVMTMNLMAVGVLAVLLAVVVLLTALTILVPLRIKAGKPPPGSGPLLVYFTAIGLGFMLVEIATMQRLNLFLGHPVYALSTVLFILLLAGGMGAFLSAWPPAARRPGALLALLLLVVAAGGAATPLATAALRAAETPWRILTAVALLFPMGLTMGMAFPLGMKWSLARAPSLGPWLWGVNGAASVCASVLAVALSMQMGISATYWAGVLCYVAAVAAWLRHARAAGTPQESAGLQSAHAPRQAGVRGPGRRAKVP